MVLRCAVGHLLRPRRVSELGEERWQIVARALARVGDKGYNLLLSNCEHFALWCVTGQVRPDTCPAPAGHRAEKEAHV